jgi:uncharacterized membrane protein
LWAIGAANSIFGFWILSVLVTLGGVFGLLFDSLLGATLERMGWLNNDSVNFLSTASSSAITLAGLAFLVSQVRL